MAQAPRNFLQEAFDAPEIQNLVQDLKHKTSIIKGAITEADIEIPDEFNWSVLVKTVLTAINGKGEVQEQQVKVMYLTTNQTLRIPAGLALHPTDLDLSEARHDAEMVERYWKAGTRTYKQLREIVNRDTTTAAKRQEIDSLPNEYPGRPTWEADNYFRAHDDIADSEEMNEYVFVILSRILKMNFDIRDLGFLVTSPATSRIRDGEWFIVSDTPVSRLKSKLHGFSLQCLAGLNLGACGGWPIGAWVRAFGVSSGILPDKDTALTKEWRFVKAVPSDEDLTKISTTHNEIGGELHTFCMNMLAMFGLFHLNKNHTYKTGDANMNRICDSYLNTLRTMVPQNVIEDLKNNKEVACRTAAHPFGLGQTYFVALLMNKGRALASPLALRTDVCPPAVMKFIIIAAAVNEWKGFPIGDSVAKMFGEQLEKVYAQIEAIKANRPAFSELHKLYGIPEPGYVDPDYREAAESMIPIVCGYSRATHITEDLKKDGLALSMSLDNVDKKAKLIAATYEHLWRNYVEAMDTGGLEEFIRRSASTSKRAK